jgi:hypothetical protein
MAQTRDRTPAVMPVDVMPVETDLDEMTMDPTVPLVVRSDSHSGPEVRDVISRRPKNGHANAIAAR